MQSDDSEQMQINERDSKFGILSRVNEIELKKYPNSLICSLDLEKNNVYQRHLGTGFFIAPNLILTSAHVIKKEGATDQTKYHKNIVANLHVHGQVQHLKGIKIIGMKIAKQCQGPLAPIYFDYALLRTQKQYKSEKYFKLVNKFDNLSQTLSLYGYPSFQTIQEKQNGFLKGSTGKKHVTVLTIQYWKNIIRHYLPSSYGNSGGPIYSSEYGVVAIHKGGTNKILQTNFGVLINSPMIENLRKWQYQWNFGKIDYKFEVIDYMAQRSKVLSPMLINISSNKKEDKIMRIQQKYYQKFPVNCVGKIAVQQNNLAAKGGNTAFLIAENLVLTTLSSVYCPAFQNFSPSNSDLKITFYPVFGNKGYQVQSFCFNKELIELKLKNLCTGNKAETFLEDVSLDYCLLKLKEKIFLPKYLELLTNFHQTYESYSLYGCSKGSDIDVQRNQIVIKGLHQSLYPIQVFPEHKLAFYSVNTQNGMSGSPIIVGNGKVIGIHKFMHKRANNCRGGRLITIDLITVLLEWAKKMNGSCFRWSYFCNNKAIPQQDYKNLLLFLDKQKEQIYETYYK